MKLVVNLLTLAILSCATLALAHDGLDGDRGLVSVIEIPAAFQKSTVQKSVLPATATLTIQEPVAPTPVDQAEPAPAPIVAAASMGNGCCSDCCQPRCCCPPPPVPTTFCLVDPCGCSHEACVEIPACCVGQQPTINWRGGPVGRQVATLCWSCCGFKAKVIVARSGKVRVRD